MKFSLYEFESGGGGSDIAFKQRYPYSNKYELEILAFYLII